MEKGRAFNFKLVLPTVNTGQVSAVRPQENAERSDDVNTVQQGYSKYFNKEPSTTFPNTSMVAPSKPVKQDFLKMKVVPPMEKDEITCNPTQLYCKLFDEVEKIRSWKVKVDSDTEQKERKLLDNKRTIENQRKAIQELQFGNESLSAKLEEQIHENEDLRNQINAIRNLGNILKDTFERSAEKMQLFESEREETHQLFMENSETIQKMIAAFEGLRHQADADQHEIHKVKQALLQFKDVKEKYCQQYGEKEEEVAILQKILKDKESELQKILLDLNEAQEHCKKLQETTEEQHEVLKNSKSEQEVLHQKWQTAEQRCKEAEINLTAAVQQSKEECAQIIQSKDVSLQELSRIKNQQEEKLEQIKRTIQELQSSLTSEKQKADELENRLMAKDKELEKKSIILEKAMEQSTKKDGQIKILKNELNIKSKSIESTMALIGVTEDRVSELTAELLRKTEEAHVLKNEAEVAVAENNHLKNAFSVSQKENEALQQKSNTSEIKLHEVEEQLLHEIKRNEEYACQVEQQRKDIALQKVKYEDLLSTLNELQSEKKVVEEQLENGSLKVKSIESNVKMNEEKVMKLQKQIQNLDEENQYLREELNTIKTKHQEKCGETKILQQKIEETCKNLMEKITEKENWVKNAEEQLCNLRTELEAKNKAQDGYQKRNKMLKKKIAEEMTKSIQLQKEINILQEESQYLKRQLEEDHQKLFKELESKKTCAAELQKEIEELKSSVGEAIKNKGEAELKCQHKIADMVALMEKHKNQYDRMLEEKDAELDQNKKKEMEAVAQRTSMELELSQCKMESDHLTKQLKAEMTEKELNDLKKEISVKPIQPLEERNKQISAPECTPVKCLETSAKRYVFDFYKTRKTPSYSKDDGSSAYNKTETLNENLKITGNTSDSALKIKSYRIRTPPSNGKTQSWEKAMIQFDPKSDSSDQSDILGFADTPVPSYSAPSCKSNIVKKLLSPVTQKSPGNSLKLAAVKRMRDAGWTAVTGTDKKKKKNEKIFA
ncbi:synaptonemal complex protein 1 isoform X2 [Thalassophryne amazonica]|uniref:synaptonemal complex protein 1 isoform X2 n=1 Tax=Thalassophryne amazonica TaxID=390379 RepID=UPI001470C800|nr:synaptonemal complex protein 1 isoform X2 [Thalassophryne amazonica]